MCPNPAHAGSRVTRAGWYGKAPHLRQRWWCRPVNGEPSHRFAEVLPRQTTSQHGHVCVECSTKLEPWEGQAGAREYLFAAREVGHALAMVASGVTYREAGRAARAMAERSHGHLTGHRRRRRDPNLDGQLVANWVDALSPLITDGELPKAWPERLAVDSVEFRVRGGQHAGQSFHVFIAVGYEQNSAQPKVWRMEAFPVLDTDAWVEFFGRLGGRPRVVVSDMDRRIRRAVAQTFPDQPGVPRTHERLCELHVKRAIENALAPLAGQPGHPVIRALRLALVDSGNWSFFEAQVKRTDQRGNPALPAMMRWLRLHGADVAASVAKRTSAGPNSTGAVEATARKLKAAFLGRSQSFGNRARMNLLLDLMTLHLNGRADGRLWADRLRERLHDRRGIAPEQRPHDDRKGQRSLVA